MKHLKESIADKDKIKSSSKYNEDKDKKTLIQMY